MAMARHKQGKNGTKGKAAAKKLAAAKTVIDPIRYEMFVHRLMNVAEEGRIALQKVCASPIVVQGGECMSSFYEADGTTILSASGHLRFSAGCEDAVKKIIEYCSDNPGINDGDQFFMNDPYIASTHVYDEMIVKPIFARGKLIAWAASMTHTADTGGILRGGATEIFHEGVRSFGIKLMEKGRIRADVFRDLTQQCRDPGYVGLDLKSRIASNNVCARGFLQLVDKYGFDFVRAACKKLNEDSERMARARLASLPDGTWRARLYATATNAQTGKPKVMRIVCAMTKKGDSISFDYDGTSEQNEDATNSTYVGSWGQLFVALTSQLFWNIPWNGGMTRPVTLKIPEGTVLNCRYPAACGGAPGIGAFMTSAASACIAKMLFAAGLPEDVNASWYGGGSGSGGFNTGGPGFMYGGKNQHGLPVGQGIYDMHASGFGAAPMRDGVSSGGHMNNPTVGISDVENIEMQYPLLYLSRNHMTDSGGFGKFRGGLGLQRIILSRGSPNLTTNYSPYHGIPSGWGLFGGYPAGIGGDKFRLDPGDLDAEFKRSRYPVDLATAAEWGKVEAPDMQALKRMAVPEGSILVDPVTVGSGYGDPLDRDPERVLRDLLDHAVSEKFARKIYGVVLRGEAVDDEATRALRDELRRRRLELGQPVPGAPPLSGRKAAGRRVLRVHEHIDVVSARGQFALACRKCDQDLGPAEGNYKTACLHCVIDKDALTELPPPGGRQSMGRYVEYYCPGCGTLLEVETMCPAVDGESVEPVWDIALARTSLQRASDSQRQEEAA
jgi:N-methylhydantoinase B